MWFCRPSGTHCFRERDVFLKDTAPHNTWRFYMEQTSDRVLAYAIELTGKERGKIKGNLYELDYSKHYERVKTHFMAELSPAFMRLAATKDTDRLFSMLPYKTLSFSKIEGRHGTYALIDKGENRDRKIRKPRPSIRAQLKADKAKTAPKKAAAKTKNHDMEV